MKKDSDDLSPRVRAEDIILGSLGFGEEARVVSIERTSDGYKGIGRWADGEEFPFESEDAMDELTEWALQILLDSKNASKKAVNT
jgi:hypothetical protein